METLKFANSDVLIIREAQVVANLSLEQAVTDICAVLSDIAEQTAVNSARVRMEAKGKRAWLHTLRAGWEAKGVVGGKDYTSIGFVTPAMWVTVADIQTGRIAAFIEADFLSRIRTAAVAAVATDLLAPDDSTCLAHFGAGKISEALIKAMLIVRASLSQVLLVRRDRQEESRTG